MEKSKENIHSVVLIIALILSIVFAFACQDVLFNLIISVMMLVMFYLNSRFGISFLLKVIWYSLFFSGMMFLLKYYHPATKFNLEKTIETAIRIFFVSLLSMSALMAIDYSKIVLFLMSKNILSKKWGYPFLVGFNSISLFKQELDRIKMNLKFRKVPFYQKILIFFPMLIFAIRHAERGALSLVTRGLNEEKSFYFDYSLSLKDKIFLFFFIVSYFALVVFFSFGVRFYP